MTPDERKAQKRGHPNTDDEKARHRANYLLHKRAAYQRMTHRRKLAADEEGLAGIRSRDGQPLVAIVVSDPGDCPFVPGAVLSYVTESLRLGIFYPGTVLSLHGHVRVVRGPTGDRQRLERYGA